LLGRGGIPELLDKSGKTFPGPGRAEPEQSRELGTSKVDISCFGHCERRLEIQVKTLNIYKTRTKGSHSRGGKPPLSYPGPVYPARRVDLAGRGGLVFLLAYLLVNVRTTVNHDTTITPPPPPWHAVKNFEYVNHIKIKIVIHRFGSVFAARTLNRVPW
jgi:hypothetical protein